MDETMSTEESFQIGESPSTSTSREIIRIHDEKYNGREKFYKVQYEGEQVPVWIKKKDVVIPKEVLTKYRNAKKMRERRKRKRSEELATAEENAEKARNEAEQSFTVMDILDDVLSLPMTGDYGPPSNPQDINELFAAEQCFQRMWDRAHKETSTLNDDEILCSRENCGFAKGLTAKRVVRRLKLKGKPFYSVEFTDFPKLQVVSKRVLADYRYDLL